MNRAFFLLSIVLMLALVAPAIAAQPIDGSTSASTQPIDGSTFASTQPIARGGTVLFSDDVESGTNGWSVIDLTANATPQFHTDSYMAYGDSGSSWWCGSFDYDADGGYGNDWMEWLALPPVDATGIVDPYLRFAHRRDCESGYDWAFVEVKQGGLFVQVSPDYTGTDDWRITELSLSSCDNPLEVRFRFRSDYSYSDEDGYYQSVGGGYMLDDIEIYDGSDNTIHFSDDAESGGVCTAGSGTGELWHIIDRACWSHSPAHSWWCGDDSDTAFIPGDVDNMLVSPSIPTDALAPGTPCTLLLYTSSQVPYAGENPWDYWAYYVSLDNGSTWSNATGYAYVNDAPSPLSVRNKVDISAFLPASALKVGIRFFTTEDGCGPGSAGGAGVTVDDVSVVAWPSATGPVVHHVPDDFSTIQAAIDASAPGDTVEVGDGVYAEAIVIDKHYLTLRAGSTPIIDLGKTSTTDPSVGACVRVEDSAIGATVSGFTLRHGDMGVDVYADNVTIEDCLIYENYGSGSSYGLGLGILAQGAYDLTIDGNEIYGNSEPGIGLYYGDDAIVRDNIVYDNGLLAGQSLRSVGIYTDMTERCEYIGNTISGHVESGIEQAGMAGETDRSIYENNVVRDNAASIRFTGCPPSTAIVQWNFFSGNTLGMLNETSTQALVDAVQNWWGDASGPDVAKRGSGDPAVGNISVDPWIGKAGGENVTCSPTPLTLSGGTPTGTVSVDYAGGASAPIKGYSIKFSWDGAVATTAPTSVTEGDFSTGVLSFFNARLSDTDEITVDCAILDGVGLSAGGTLFEVEFSGQSVDYSTCDLTLFDLDFRDVHNDPVAGIYDADGEIIVDLVGPSISGVTITNPTLPHTDDFIKNTDTAVVTAIVTDTHPLFSSLDIEADLSGFGGGTINPTTYDGTTASWTVAGVTCSPTDAAITVTVSSTDPYGNAGTPGSDNIMADNTHPDAITGLDASPAHEEVVLVWDDPTGLDTNLRGVMVRYDAWGDYPFYATADPGYPATETGGDGTAYNALGVSSGATHAIVPRDIHNYTAFVYDQVLLYGPAVATAQDRATNYWLGDVANVASNWIPDGLVTVADIDKLGGTYAVSSPSLPDAQCNVGPTDDFSRVGIPLPNAGTGPVVNFEDLMIFSMNYGVVAPRVVPLLSGPAEGELALRLEEVGRNEEGIELALVLSGNGGEVKGTSATLEFDGAEFVSARLSEEMSSPAAETFFWSGEMGGHVLVDLAILGTDVTIGGSGELARIIVQPSADEYGVTFADATLRDAENTDLTADLEGIEIIDEIPTVFRLVQNAPNPFNPMTTIAYHVPHESDVTIRVYDVTGRVVRTLVDGMTEPGRHAAVWDGRSEQGEACGSGVYFCVMETPEYRGSRKMMLLK